jgi:hypothetical protein
MLGFWVPRPGLYPFNPDKVLQTIQKSEQQVAPIALPMENERGLPQAAQLVTATTSESLISLRKKIDENLAGDEELDCSCKTQIHKLANAAEKAFADRAILLDENLLLFEQNNERNTSKSRQLQLARQKLWASLARWLPPYPLVSEVC